MILRRSAALPVLGVTLLAAVLFASACGGQETTTISGAATTLQVVTTAAPTTTAPAAPTLETYRTEMKALWDKSGPVLDTMSDSLDFSDPGNLSEADIQAVQAFVDAMKAFVAGLEKITPPADLADAHAKYADVLGRLAAEFDKFVAAAKENDVDAITNLMSSINAIFEQEDAAMTEAEATLEEALGFSLSGDSSTSTTSAPTLGDDAQTYTDPTYGFSFQYPAGWTLDENAIIDTTAGSGPSGRVGAFDPEGAVSKGIYMDIMGVSTYPLNVTLTDADIPALEAELQATLGDLESQAVNAQVISPLAPAELAGLKGYAITYTFDKDGVPATSTLYFLFKGDMEYQVTIQAATENWAKNEATFAAMLASFTAP